MKKEPITLTENVPQGKAVVVAFPSHEEMLKRKIAPIKPPIPTAKSRPMFIIFDTSNHLLDLWFLEAF